MQVKKADGAEWRYFWTSSMVSISRNQKAFSSISCYISLVFTKSVQGLSWMLFKASTYMI